jgi:hypothetical protein
MSHRGHCLNRAASLNMMLRVGSCKCGDDGSTKKGAGHAFQPVHPSCRQNPPDPNRLAGFSVGSRTQIGIPQDRLAIALRLKSDSLIARLETLDHGKTIPVSRGLVHHWIGTVFIPGATLAQTPGFMEDYDHKQDYFRPDIQRSLVTARSAELQRIASHFAE